MREAETVTFGGSAFDRAAHLRGDAEAIERAWRHVHAGVLPVWRGKPLLAGAHRRAPAWLPPTHPVLAAPRAPAIFLGLDGAAPRFAADVSDWTPKMLPETIGAFHDPSEQRHPELPEDHAYTDLRAAMTRLDARGAELAATARGLTGWHRRTPFCARCGAASVPAMAGWQRACPVCGAHHFPRTDPVAIMLVTHGNHVLLGRSPAWPEAMFSLLAGFVEPGEPVEAAVRREVFEETAVQVGAVGYLATQPWPFPASLMIGCRAAALSTEIRIDPAEIAAARWVSREEVLASLAGENPGLAAARPGAIAHFLLRNWLADRLD